MNSKKHGEYRRPEITRTNDLLAQDQRRVIEYQSRRLENIERKSVAMLLGNIKSKIFSNTQSNADFCFNFCLKKNTARLDSPLARQKELTEETDRDCFQRCILKRAESFNMLLVVRTN